MQALYHVNNCGWKVSAEPVGGGKQREYFIAAQEVIWNYGPGGINKFNGQPLDKPGRYHNIEENSKNIYVVTCFPLPHSSHSIPQIINEKLMGSHLLIFPLIPHFI